MQSLSDEEQAFVERFGLLLSESGLPRSTGRVWGLLLICEPAQQSAEDIQQKLSLSVGSVSNAVSLLTKTRLINRAARPGDRRMYYEADPDCWRHVLESRIQQIDYGIAIAEEGLTIRPNARLESMRELYTGLKVLTKEVQDKLLD